MLDVTSQESIDKMLTNYDERLGMPLILINNAGITADNLLMRMKDEEWDNVINAPIYRVYLK